MPDEAETIHYIDADGGWFELHDAENYYVTLGESGRMSVNYNFVSEPVYGLNGDLLRGVRADVGEVEVPVIIMGRTETEFLQKLRLFRYAINPLRGSGKLRYKLADGSVRYLNCHLSDMPIVETEDKGGGLTWRSFVAIFTTHDPFFYDPLETEVTWQDPQYDLAKTQVIYNKGDEDTQPIWNIQGPLTYLKIQNMTTGKWLDITYNLPASQSIYIDTRKGEWSMLKNHTTNVAKYRSMGADLFPLVPGANRIVFVITQSSYDMYAWVKCRWVDRYGGI